MRKIHLFRLFASLIVAAVVPAVHGAEPASTQDPARELYIKVQKLRDEAWDVRSTNNNSKSSLVRAEAYLNQAMRLLKSKSAYELANGNNYLKYRVYDVDRDLAAIYALRGDKEKAIYYLELMQQVAWNPDVIDEIVDDPSFNSIKDDKRLKSIIAVLKSTERLYDPHAFASNYRPSLSMEERISGLSLIWSEVRNDFANFDSNPLLNWNTEYQTFLPQVIEAGDTKEYYRLLMKFVASLHDGHTNVYPPRDLYNTFYARPPIQTRLIDDHVYITKILDETVDNRIKVGDEILQIDKIDVKDYVREYVEPYVSSSTPQDKNIRMYDYQLLAGDVQTPIVLTIRDRDGVVEDVKVKRVPYKHSDQILRKYQLKRLPGGFVYFAISDFASDAVVKAFEAALPVIMRSKGLILDLRDNGGGSSQYGFSILSNLTNTPIPGIEFGIPYHNPLGLAHGDASVEWLHPAHGDYSSPSKMVYNGPVALLIGPKTFSAGEDFVMEFSYLKRGVLVGSETAGSSGQPLEFDLPGGGTARICVVRETYPDGRQFVGRGIKPDIVVKETVSDFLAGRDAVLQSAIEALRKQITLHKLSTSAEYHVEK